MPQSRYIPIKEPGTNWLLFKLDPDRMLIEIQRRGKKTVIDLEEEIKRAKEGKVSRKENGL